MAKNDIKTDQASDFRAFVNMHIISVQSTALSPNLWSILDNGPGCIPDHTGPYGGFESEA